MTLRWTPAPGAGGYVLAAGSAAGRSDILVTTLGATPALAAPAPAGRYFVRVAAVNGCGVGTSSGEILVVVP